MSRRRSLTLIVLAVPLAVAGLFAGYVKLELVEPRNFAERAVDALQTEEVRTAIAEQVTVEVIERGSPDLVASRPLVLSVVEAVLETDEFERILDRAARSAHEVLLEGHSNAIIELEQAGELLLPALTDIAPEIAQEVPTDISPRIAEIRSSDAATWVLRAARGANAAALPLLVVALVGLALAVALAPDRRRALLVAGLAPAGGALAAIIGLAALRAQVVSGADALGVLSDDTARAAAGAAWDALAGDLESWFAAVGVGGLALAAGTLLAEARVDRAAALRHAAHVVAGGDLPAIGRLLRGLTLAAVGALILLRAEPLVSLTVMILGGALVLLGLAEAASTARPRGRPAPAGHPRRRHAAAALGGAALVAAAVTALVVVRDGPPDPPPSEEITSCNGLPQLCDRRLDQVVLPGTHNSMSAADRPGWFFANQIRPIPRQLDDGIRFLMIDPHYGVVDSQGRVRTDLAAEGMSRNRVAADLGADAVSAAERLAGQLGLVPTAGERSIFLCHTLCELGAERISSTLDEIRGFLEHNPTEVLVVFIESSIDPDDVERSFEDADLEPYLAALPRRGPLPTLREMIAAGRRLVVLDEDDGGEERWYQPGYLFAQETRVDALLRSPTGCEPGRGAPESPLFLMNHWIDRFPPPRSENQAVGTRQSLLRRVRSCEAQLGRTPNLIAVDFYERSDVVATSRELNVERAG